MAAKGDYARQIWYSRLGETIKHMMRTPIFALLGDHNFSFRDLKENNFSTKHKTWQKTAARTSFFTQLKFFWAQTKLKHIPWCGTSSKLSIKAWMVCVFRKSEKRKMFIKSENHDLTKNIGSSSFIKQFEPK